MTDITPRKNPSKFMKVARYFFENANPIRLIPLHEKVHSILIRANIELGKLSPQDPIFALRLREFNQAVLELQKSKWYAEAAGRKIVKDGWRKCFQAANRSIQLGNRVYTALVEKSTQPVVTEFDAITPMPGTEIDCAGDMPILPASNPVVILQGSDYEMGYQYARQVIQIFGRWVFTHKAGRSFTEDEYQVHRNYEAQMRQHTPELLDMIRGWADGATASGVAMSYEDVLDIWAGHSRPTNFYQAKGDWDKAMDRMPILCSGVAAWGRATVDGKLVAGASGDHDATFMVTIVAFPETGNPYIFTPFSVYGDVPVVGNVGLMGHPGMNARGLAYVHHGGVPKMIEDRSEWGYGIRRGMSVLHILRFANSAREAREMELNFPVGDVGMDPANTAGGFYADSSYGYVAESRKNPIIIREAGVLGETDFLYANNSAAHPQAEQAGWMKPFRDRWMWDQHGGWRPVSFQPPSLVTLRKPSGAELVNAIMNLMYSNSCGRNNFVFSALNPRVGRIDFDTIQRLYRRSGILPPGSFEEIAAGYKKNGEWGQVTTGHAGNAVVAMMKPSEGRYAVCVGPAARGLTAHAPLPHCGPVYGETNAFWEIRLGQSPVEVMLSASENAQQRLREAETALAALPAGSPAAEGMQALIVRAREYYSTGQKLAAQANGSGQRASVSILAQATRAYNWTQVLSSQAAQRISPPARLPLDLESEEPECLAA
ncbi:MAG: hypothetical protein HY835_01600 [Anaerolineae bacterium]|nr:hypothetical protein [Anaerolineae bacterium]